MPPAQKPLPIEPKNASMEQAALHIAAQMARGMRPGGKNGPDYQLLVDFFDSIHARADEERRRDANNQDKNKEIEEGNRLKPSEQSPTRGKVVERLYQYRSSLNIRLQGLAKALNDGDAEKAKKILGHVVNELKRFAADYAAYKETAGQDLNNRHPELHRFTKFWENGEYREGKEVEKVLNSALEAAPQKGESTAPEEAKEKKPIQAAIPEEAEPEDAPLNINDFYIENERKQAEGQRFKARVTRDVYTAGKSSYEGVLGTCEAKAKTSGADLQSLLATALAAAKLRREGKPFDMVAVENEAEELRYGAGFPAMAQNPSYIREVLSRPEEIDQALDTYQREKEIEAEGGQRKRGYDEYLRLHTWPNVPAGKETEYLAKAIAAHRLAANGNPFDLETIRSDAKQIRKQASFKELTTMGFGKTNGPATVRRWLNRESLQPASHELERQRQNRIRNNKLDAPDKKTWAGYRRMHTKENVPAGASPEEKRKMLAKAVIGVLGMTEDETFSVKAARKAADKLMKNKYFLAVTKDPEKVSKLLETGKVTQVFDDMAAARRSVLFKKNPDAEISRPVYQGQEGPTKKPKEKPIMSI